LPPFFEDFLFPFLPTGTTLLAAAGFLIHCGPRAALGFLLRYALLLVAFFDVFSFAFLFVGVTTFVSSRHRSTSLANRFSKQRAEKSRERKGAERMPEAGIVIAARKIKREIVVRELCRRAQMRERDCND
jgi:hypothetical protein